MDQPKNCTKREKQSFSDIGPNEWFIQEVPFSDAEVTFSAANADEKSSRFLAFHLAQSFLP